MSSQLLANWAFVLLSLSVSSIHLLSPALTCSVLISPLLLLLKRPFSCGRDHDKALSTVHAFDPQSSSDQPCLPHISSPPLALRCFIWLGQACRTAVAVNVMQLSFRRGRYKRSLISSTFLHTISHADVFQCTRGILD